MTTRRYAIFYTPYTDPLAEFGVAWLGWDARSGRTKPDPVIPHLPMPWNEIVQAPRKYGFHGTLKPPFKLAEHATENDLIRTMEVFCQERAPVPLNGLELSRLGRFLALVPLGDAADLSKLAADIVRTFDALRMPSTPQEMERRRAPGLSPIQETLLQKWGYPYVMEAFRFHMTLTGKLPKAKLPGLQSILSAHLAPLIGQPFDIQHLSLMGEGHDGMFRLIRRFELTGSRQKRAGVP